FTVPPPPAPLSPLFPYTTLFRSSLPLPAPGWRPARHRFHERHFECNLPFPCAGVVRNGFSSSVAQDPEPPIAPSRQKRRHRNRGDRKSTRLNSSHQIISYAVFCL